MTSPRLPTLPRVAFRILQLVQSPDVHITELADTIAADPALSAKILKVANSGAYGRVRGVSKLREAVMMLGLRNVKTLALGFSLVSDLANGNGGGLDYTAFWRRSLVAACAAKGLSGRIARDESEEAFLGGLIHCIGIVALDRALGADYGEVAAALGEGPEAFLRREEESIGVQHTEVGAMMANAWNLPAELSACITHYADPSKAPEELRQLVTCVSLGAYCGDVWSATDPGGALLRLRTAAASAALTEAEADELLCEALSSAALLQQVFEGAGAEMIVPSEILARATEALLEMNLDSANENQRLETEKVALAKDVMTDGLTGIANRRYLDQFLVQQCEIARRYRAPLSLLIIDLDHFKRINDTFGHQAGDAVLRAVAGRVAETVRTADLVARYGGEEFAVVLPATSAAGALDSAERIRLAIAAAPTGVSNGENIAVTVSVGVAAFHPGDEAGVEGLLRAADQALYAAKALGRNTVQAAA